MNAITTNQTFSNIVRFKYDYSEKTSFDLRFSQLFTRVDSPSGDSSSVTSTGAMPTLQVPLPQVLTSTGATSTGATSTGVTSTAVTSTGVDSVESNKQYETRAGMNYQLFPKTKIGLEGVGGILDQSSSPLQYYQQARLRVNYVATGKLVFNLSGGVEAREFDGRDNVKISPVFSLASEDRPFDGTYLSVIFYRTVSASDSLTGQDVTATGFEIAATQRFLQKFIAGLSFGYENDVYFASSAETLPGTDRVDNYLFVRPRLSYSLVRCGSRRVFFMSIGGLFPPRLLVASMTIELAWRLWQAFDVIMLAKPFQTSLL